MLTVDEALARILSEVPQMPVELVGLADVYGRVLAEDLRAAVDVPPWDNSAMDGYAVRAADTAGASPERGVTLALIERIGAGSVARNPVGAGQATSIMTGAPVPDGADAVIPIEDTDRAASGEVTVFAEVPVGHHVRRRGEDLAKDAVALPAGARMSAAAAGVAASIGNAAVPVRRRPVVAILSTGDEVVPVGAPLRPGQIWSSNNATLVGLALAAGAVPLDHGVAPDDLDATVHALRRAVRDADAVVTTGGVSVGAYDVVKEAFAVLGAGIDFWRVRMKPGKPLAFGRIDAGDGRKVPLFGLPGNPVSCAVNFLQFVRPWLRIAVGDPRPYLPVVEAVAGEGFHEPPGRARLVRVVLDGAASGGAGGAPIARPTGSQSSGVLTSMARSHGLMLLGPDAPSPAVGDRVRVQITDPGYADSAVPGYGW